MCFNDGAGDIEAETRAGLVESAASVRFIKPVEDKGQVGFGNAIALVVDADLGLLSDVPYPQLDTPPGRENLIALSQRL